MLIFIMRNLMSPKKIWVVLTSGFAVFSMFFGSGNLVFPITLGKIVKSGYVSAAIGLIISGIILPTAGLIAMLLYRGSVDKFFSTLSPKLSFLLPLIMLGLLGPFGVIPRCITVAYGSIENLNLVPGLSGFSMIFCVSIYVLLRTGNKFIDVLGGILTPIFLGCLGLIIFQALKIAPDISAIPSSKALAMGVSQGYQMMDLLAAFFFGATVIQHIDARMPIKNDNAGNLKITLCAIAIGALLLGIIYIIMVYLGSLYWLPLENILPEQSIAKIAELTLGQYNAYLVAAIVCMACLTTAVALAGVCISFTKEKIFRNNINFHAACLIILCISYAVSLMRFEGIALAIAPILEILYPVLILLTFLNIVHYFKPLKHINTLIIISCVLSMVTYFISSARL